MQYGTILKEIECEIGGQKIDRHYGHWLSTWADLTEPNPTGDSAIAMLGTLPKEFNLDDYIDYDKQFQKSFLDPMKGILDTIGWECEKKATIMDFFS